MEEQTVSGICLEPTAKFQGSYKIPSLKMGHMVTRQQNIHEIPIPTWFIRRIESLATNYRRDLFDGNETLFVDHFANKNDFLPPSMGVALQEWHRLMMITMMMKVETLMKPKNLRITICRNQITLPEYPLILQQPVEKLQE